MQFNKSSFNMFREDFRKAMQGIEDKYNILIEMGNISYDDLHFTTKLNCVKNERGLDTNKIEFERSCAYIGLSPELYNKKVWDREHRKEYVIVGINLKANKYPVIVQEVGSDRRVRLTVGYLKACLGIV